MRASLVIIAVLAVVAAPGCLTTSGASNKTQARILVRVAANDASELPDSPEKEALLGRLAELGDILGGRSQADDPSEAVTSAEWYDTFGPKKLAIYYHSTRLVDFDGDGARETLEVAVGVEDQFGDPVKAFGAFRVETFNYQKHSLENRGRRVGNWYIPVHTRKEVKKYYDSRSRCFLFPLKLTHGVETEKTIVQVMYYYPDGSGNKLIARRVVKVSQ